MQKKTFINHNSKLIKFELLKNIFLLKRKDDIFIKSLKEQIIFRFKSSLETIGNIYEINILPEYKRPATYTYSPYGYDTPLPVRSQNFTS
jgi:hypothetical protein